jgi:hypothetical protein
MEKRYGTELYALKKLSVPKRILIVQRRYGIVVSLPTRRRLMSRKLKRPSLIEGSALMTPLPMKANYGKRSSKELRL